MNKSLSRVTGWAVLLVSAAGVSTALFAHDPTSRVSAQPAGPAGDSEILNKSYQLTSDLTVDVRLWLSNAFPLTTPLPDGTRSVRIVSLTTDYHVNHLSLAKGQVFGPTYAERAEKFSLGNNTINLGYAKKLAAQILGQTPAAEFAPETVGPFQGTVRPAEGKTWAMVTSEADLDISFKAK